MPLLPVILLLGGGAVLLIVAFSKGDTPPVHEPDLETAPTGQTKYKLVNAILPLLQKAAASSGIPLGLMVGWIAKESGGKIGEVTSLGERGLFQLMVDEAKKVGFDDLPRLSTDVVYSINAGLALIGLYMGDADQLAIAPHGSDYYFKLVKLIHSMGKGAVAKIVGAAKNAGETGSWQDLETYATDHEAELLHTTKHSPTKWFDFVDSVYAIGAPFGFGTKTSLVGGAVFTDIPDPLDHLR